MCSSLPTLHAERKSKVVRAATTTTDAAGLPLAMSSAAFVVLLVSMCVSQISVKKLTSSAKLREAGKPPG
jgi:membrane-anchored protein YejM (alkaline phosphatase superfamily)